MGQNQNSEYFYPDYSGTEPSYDYDAYGSYEFSSYNAYGSSETQDTMASYQSNSYTATTFPTEDPAKPVKVNPFFIWASQFAWFVIFSEPQDLLRCLLCHSARFGIYCRVPALEL